VLTRQWGPRERPQGGNDVCGSKDLPAWPVLTLNPGSSVRVYPRGPGTRLRRTPLGPKGLCALGGCADLRKTVTRQPGRDTTATASGVSSVASNHETE
jgi:hypothetical protein